MKAGVPKWFQVTVAVALGLAVLVYLRAPPPPPKITLLVGPYAEVVGTNVYVPVRFLRPKSGGPIEASLEIDRWKECIERPSGWVTNQTDSLIGLAEMVDEYSFALPTDAMHWKVAATYQFRYRQKRHATVRKWISDTDAWAITPASAKDVVNRCLDFLWSETRGTGEVATVLFTPPPSVLVRAPK